MFIKCFIHKAIVGHIEICMFHEKKKKKKVDQKMHDFYLFINISSLFLHFLPHNIS